MIQKLRVRFVILAMSTLLTVLLVLVGGINIANYTGIVSEADRLLSPDNLGRMEKTIGGKADIVFNGPLAQERHNYARFFSVTLAADGTILDVQIPVFSFVEREEATALAEKVCAQPSDNGFQSVYRYSRQSSGDDTVTIRFLDCGRELGFFQRFLLVSLILSALGVLVLFGIVVYFSGRIVRPFAESYEKQKQFITDAGHEIKTPLTIIQADADVLEMDLGENEWLADIQNNVRRLTDLTNDLVSLARMEEGGTPLELVEIPISDVVVETAQSFRTLAQAQNKELIIRAEPMLSMDADEKAIAKLVGILMDNALKYAPEGTAIILCLEKQGKQLRLWVENVSAVPLPEGNLNRLFERFYRTDPSRNSQSGGHGIGLSIASAIASAHNGQIHASQPRPDSLRITVTFPRQQKVSCKRT